MRIQNSENFRRNLRILHYRFCFVFNLMNLHKTVLPKDTGSTPIYYTILWRPVSILYAMFSFSTTQGFHLTTTSVLRSQKYLACHWNWILVWVQGVFLFCFIMYTYNESSITTEIEVFPLVFSILRHTLDFFLGSMYALLNALFTENLLLHQPW